uniref:Uncharacterized protein n=1 Tax=Trypanosoma congolense (strain IL3000) TaxID=1068625 RepID=G0UM41_TRYCI|nr:hypothetical protein, unlikely [Trypanosoma congolense IL3000]
MYCERAVEREGWKGVLLPIKVTKQILPKYAGGVSAASSDQREDSSLPSPCIIPLHLQLCWCGCFLSTRSCKTLCCSVVHSSFCVRTVFLPIFSWHVRVLIISLGR